MTFIAAGEVLRRRRRRRTVSLRLDDVHETLEAATDCPDASRWNNLPATASSVRPREKPPCSGA